MKESKIIECFFERSELPGDDCFFRDGFLYTTDSLAEGTHFRHEWSSPADLAHKLFHVNLSDIVAGGGEPEFCFLTLGLSEFSSRESWIGEFSSAFRNLSQNLGIRLVGGDTYFSQITHLGMTLVGKTDAPVFRSGGKDGDFLYCTGKLGYSFLGMEFLLGKEFPKIDSKIRDLAIEKHLRPTARQREFRNLRENFTIHAAMDCTDGLKQDLQKLAINSGLEILFLSPEEIPEDYASKIGTTKKGSGIQFLRDGIEFVFQESGFNHFS